MPCHRVNRVQHVDVAHKGQSDVVSALQLQRRQKRGPQTANDGSLRDCSSAMWYMVGLSSFPFDL